jgi:hypothetical protein
VERFLILIGLQPNIFAIAVVCAAVGAFIMSRFTVSLGMLTYPINFFVLMKRVDLPLDYDFDRPLTVSIIGMAVASLLALAFLSRNRQND